MIYTVTFNPAIDYVVRLDAPLEVGAVNRAQGEDCVLGGKGINVSGVLAQLGCKSVALGFVAGETGAWLERGLAAQGLGTSMLQMGNIVRNPRVWIPPTLAAAVTGPIATCIFGLQMNGPAVSSGMGTCGLVGQIGVYTGWVSDVAAGLKPGIGAMDWLGLALISFVLPAVLTWLFAMPLRKWGWIKPGDLKLDL